MAQRGLYMTIVDSALVESGLADSWLESLSFGTSYEWIKSSGRRPMICHVEPIANSQFELNNLIVTSGRIVEIIHRELTLETVDDFVDICLTHEVGKLTIRAGLPPEIQPKLQGSLDRQLARRHGTRDAFLLSNPSGNNFLLCVTN